MGEPRPLLVDELEIEKLPGQATSRLLVELVQDGLGRPVRVPVLVARGKRPGPILGITSALHGNELNGIRVIHALLEQLDLARLRGSIVAVVVANVPGFERRQRAFSEGTDLNHIMPGDPRGNAADVYAHRLVDRLVIRSFDYLVDLHTASFGRANSLYVRADLNHEVTAQMAYLLRPQIIVHNPPSDHTLRGTAAERGIPAITVEVGDPQRFQPRYIRGTLVGLRAVLGLLGMIARRPVAPGAEPLLCQRSYWLRTAHGGLLEVLPQLTDQVQAGAIIARLANVFGDLTEEYQAPEAGVVIGKNLDPVARTGDRILHLGVLAGDDHDFHRR